MPKLNDFKVDVSFPSFDDISNMVNLLDDLINRIPKNQKKRIAEFKKRAKKNIENLISISKEEDFRKSMIDLGVSEGTLRSASLKYEK